jgi:hypothetical protein
VLKKRGPKMARKQREVGEADSKSKKKAFTQRETGK